MKIMIIGSGGQGKSTFAGQLGPLLDIPIVHLDRHYWKPGWVKTPEAEWDELQRQLMQSESWIIDGNYGGTLELRMNSANVIIFFDLSPWIATYRVIKRRIQYHGRSRPDLDEACPESLDWDFIKWVWNFRKTRRQKILDRLKKFAEGRNIIILKRRKDVRKLLQRAASEGKEIFRPL